MPIEKKIPQKRKEGGRAVFVREHAVHQKREEIVHVKRRNNGSETPTFPDHFSLCLPIERKIAQEKGFFLGPLGAL